MSERCCAKHWTGCAWCRRVFCPDCPVSLPDTLCKMHTRLARRRYDLAAEVEAFNTWLGPNVPLEVSEKLWVPHQLIGFGSQHAHECFVQEVWYFDYPDRVALWIKTRYGMHRTSWVLKPHYWAKLLKQVGIERIPKAKS